MAWTNWSLDPSLIYVVIAGVLYVLGSRRSRWPRPLQAASFFAGLLTIVIALDSPIDAYADQLFWVHMLQHVLLLTFAPPLILTLAVLGLPLGIYDHWLERAYHQSVQGWGSWALDWGKEQVIAIIFGTLLVWLLYAVIRRSPQRWWFYFWLIALPIVVFVIFVQPLVIDPLFFKFEPLQSARPVLTGEIGKVVQRAGMNIPPSHMFEMKASAKLNSLNAYVTGLGASKRVVVWDTTIARMTAPETLSVFGHEMGHYVLGHVFKGITFSAGVLLVFLYLGFRLVRWSLARWGAGWDIRGAHDWAADDSVGRPARECAP